MRNKRKTSFEKTRRPPYVCVCTCIAPPLRTLLCLYIRSQCTRHIDFKPQNNRYPSRKALTTLYLRSTPSSVSISWWAVAWRIARLKSGKVARSVITLSQSATWKGKVGLIAHFGLALRVVSLPLGGYYYLVRSIPYTVSYNTYFVYRWINNWQVIDDTRGRQVVIYEYVYLLRCESSIYSKVRTYHWTEVGLTPEWYLRYLPNFIR